MMNFKFPIILFLVFCFLFLVAQVEAAVELKDVYAFGGINSLGEGVRMLVIPVFSIAGILVTFYFLIGALKYIFSRGEKNELEGARNMMTHAIIGFIILVAIFFIMQYLSEIFGIPNII